MQLNRRQMVRSGAAALGLSFLGRQLAGAAGERKKVLFFSRSVLYEHSVVRRQGQELSLAERTLVELGKQANFEVDCIKDGTVFDGNLQQYAVVVACSCGAGSDMMKPKSLDGSRPMSAEGLRKLQAAVAGGLGFVAVHPGILLLPEAIGAGCIGHGVQQQATMQVASPKFPGVEGLEKSFSLMEEWFALKDFAPDLHVILAQDSGAMAKATPRDKTLYNRPPYPATWARQHGNGRVFYTSMGHREDVWTGKLFQAILLGALSWSMKRVDVDIRPNVAEVTPKANQLTN